MELPAEIHAFDISRFSWWTHVTPSPFHRDQVNARWDSVSVISYRCNDSHRSQLPACVACVIVFISHSVGNSISRSTVSGQVHMNTTKGIRLVTIAVVWMISCGYLFTHLSLSFSFFVLFNAKKLMTICNIVNYDQFFSQKNIVIILLGGDTKSIKRCKSAYIYLW